MQENLKDNDSPLQSHSSVSLNNNEDFVISKVSSSKIHIVKEQQSLLRCTQDSDF